MTTTNYYSWANENLSDNRARAFKEALRKIDDSKFSDEWKNASRECDVLVRDYVMAHKEEITGIENKAAQEINALQAQIAELNAKVLAIKEARDEAVMQIRTGGYRTDEYARQSQLASDLWHRDDAAVQPLRDALVAKYAAAQAKASA